ncbi:MAG: His/Gly/Thr/Pro-type tRNA ligase C-terminal domain-containing protein [Waterburya sp.]
MGDQEVSDNTLSIRTRASGELGAIAVDEVIAKLTTAISEHSKF